MTEIYPELGQTFDKQLKAKLHEIGFTRWVDLKKENRDGKIRLTWSCPVDDYKEWFLILLVLENDQLYIDLLRNPLGQAFEKTDVAGLIAYINKVVRKS